MNDWKLGCGSMIGIVVFVSVALKYPIATFGILIVLMAVFFFIGNVLTERDIEESLTVSEESLKKREKFLFSEKFKEQRHELLQFMHKFKNRNGRFPSGTDKELKRAFQPELPFYIDSIEEYTLVIILVLHRANLKEMKSVTFEFVHAYEELYGTGFEDGYSTMRNYQFPDENGGDNFEKPSKVHGDHFKVFHIIARNLFGVEDMRDSREQLRKAIKNYGRVMKKIRAKETKNKYLK